MARVGENMIKHTSEIELYIILAHLATLENIWLNNYIVRLYRENIGITHTSRNVIMSNEAGSMFSSKWQVVGFPKGLKEINILQYIMHLFEQLW